VVRPATRMGPQGARCALPRPRMSRRRRAARQTCRGCAAHPGYGCQQPKLIYANHLPMASTRITSDPKVMFAKPVIAGTRITVEHILRCLAAGETPDDIVSDCPAQGRGAGAYRA
jgi:uncharacterized protein (DUF433 family)